MRWYTDDLGGGSAGGSDLPGVNNGAGEPTEAMPFSGVYGSGQRLVMTETADFVVPAGVTRARVRAIGAGGGLNSALDGGATAGGDTLIGAGGSILKAGGGKAGTASTPGAGGIATGGDVNRAGGPGVIGQISRTGSTNSHGGGAAANVLEPGRLGGNGLGQNGRRGLGAALTSLAHGQPGVFDSMDHYAMGGGGAGPGSDGANGGGGGSGNDAIPPGRGGFPGGGGGGRATSDGTSDLRGSGGGAFAMKDISGLQPGTAIPCTVGAAPAFGGQGLIIWEW